MFIECEYVNKNEIYYWKLKIVHDNQTHGEKAANKWIKKAKKWKRRAGMKKYDSENPQKTKRKEKKRSHMWWQQKALAQPYVCACIHIYKMCVYEFIV